MDEKEKTVKCAGVADASEKEYRGVVDEMHLEDGKHGPYAKANVEKLGRVTFSLKPPVWKEKDMPELGIVVILSDIREKRAGWRAYKARFSRP